MEKKPGHENTKSWIFAFGKAEIGLRTAIFRISAKMYRGYRNSRPNPLLGGVNRGRLKISIPNMTLSYRKPCPIFQGEPLCEDCPAGRNSKPHLGNSHTKTERQFLKINTVRVLTITTTDPYEFRGLWGGATDRIQAAEIRRASRRRTTTASPCCTWPCGLTTPSWCRCWWPRSAAWSRRMRSSGRAAREYLKSPQGIC